MQRRENFTFWTQLRDWLLFWRRGRYDVTALSPKNDTPVLVAVHYHSQDSAPIAAVVSQLGVKKNVTQESADGNSLIRRTDKDALVSR